jgi:hypothetical protein
MTIEMIRLNTAAELFQKLSDPPKQHLVYRGQRNACWKLSSTLSRHTRAPFDRTTTSLLDRMLNKFVVYTKGIGLEPPYGEKDTRHGRLEFARHYGVPSPLIDFTYSPYIAAFFAFTGVCLPEANEHEAAIYCLNLYQMAELWARHCTQNNRSIVPINDRDSIRPDAELYSGTVNRFQSQPGVFDRDYPLNLLQFLPHPASWNQRMRRQIGCFLYDSIDYRKLQSGDDLEGFLNQPEVPGHHAPVLTKITISHKAAPDVLRHLDLMGFSATYLYGSYEGAALDVIDDYIFPRTSGRVWDLQPPE